MVKRMRESEREGEGEIERKRNSKRISQKWREKRERGSETLKER